MSSEISRHGDINPAERVDNQQVLGGTVAVTGGETMKPRTSRCSSYT